MKHALEYEESQKQRPPQTPSQSSEKKKGGPTHQQTDILQTFSEGTPYDKNNRWWVDMTNAITVYLCKDTVPFLTVDKSALQNMIKTLDPRYDVPSRKHLSQTEMHYANTMQQLRTSGLKNY